jgi:diguanylate cyclase (GGDEF)-like protein
LSKSIFGLHGVKKVKDMVDKFALESKSSPLLKKILALLAELNKSRQGVVFYNHIKQTLEDWEATHTKTVETYAGLINLLLETFASQLPPDSVALAHLKLVQTCLTPPLSDAELNLLNASVEQAADILKHSSHIDADELNDTLMPLLQRVANTEEASPYPQPTPKEAKKAQDNYEQQGQAYPESSFEEDADELIDENSIGYEESEIIPELEETVKSTGQTGSYESRPLKAPKAVLKMLRFPEDHSEEVASEDEAFTEADEDVLVSEGTDSLEDIYPTLTEAEQVAESAMEEPFVEDSEEEVASNYRLQRSDDNEMERLHRDFVRQMRAIVAENAEFGVHLGLEIDALDDATKIHHVEDRRKAILASMKKLSESHTQLAKKFGTAQTYLSIIESDKQKLSDELDRARMLSLTDELTALPNRRAFMRRMDDEVSRVKRYGFPLSLVLIDIDHFKQVNDKYGHAAGDTVLRIYSEKILSIFRHHDMIARYGGEEFAVLLPNTDLDGVLRALDKVKSTVPKVQCKIGGITINAPTFSAGVTEYRAPETPTQFIERADHALYRAKRLGRNRIEVEQKDNEHGLLDQT